MDKISSKDMGNMFNGLRGSNSNIWPLSEDFSGVDEAYVEKIVEKNGYYDPTYVFLKGNFILRSEITSNDEGNAEINTSAFDIRKISCFQEKINGKDQYLLNIKEISVRLDNQMEFSFAIPTIKLLGPLEHQMGFSKKRNEDRYINFVKLLKQRIAE